MTNKSKLSYFLILLLLFTTAFQFSAWGVGEVIYPVLRNIIIALIVLLFAISFKNPLVAIRKTPLIRIHLYGMLVFGAILILLLPWGFKINITPLRDLALALVIILIGYNINLNEKQLANVTSVYIVLYTLSALSIVNTFSGGFVIQERYLPIPKNQFAPAYGVAFILALYFGFKTKRFKKLFYFGFAGLLLAALLVIRGRAVILAIFVTLIIFIFYYLKSRKYKILSVIIGIALLPIMGQFIYDALFLNYDVSDIDSISSGRFDTYLYGVDFFLNYPFGGILEQPQYRGGTIHNYLLYNLVNYGIFISFILFIIFFKYIFTIYNAIRNNNFEFYETGPLVMVLIFIVSMLEYTYPYAPGSAVFFPFILMGIYLKRTTTLTNF